MKFKKYIQDNAFQNDSKPSLHTWDKIQERINNPSVVKKDKNFKLITLAAACIILTFVCAYFIIKPTTKEVLIVKGNDNEKINPIVNIKKDTNNTKNETIIYPKKLNTDDANDNKINNENIVITKNNNVIEKDTITKDNQDLLKINNKPKEEIKIVSTNLDTVKVKSNKKNFVDPNMLLYSIENKESLKEIDNKKSKVTIIDFNK